MIHRRNTLVLALTAAFWLAPHACRADPAINSGYNLNLFDLGSVSLPITPNTYQGLAFQGQNLFLAAWQPANYTDPTSQTLWQIPVTNSGTQPVTLGSASAYANVSTTYDGLPFTFVVSGGLSFGSDGTLFYTTTEGIIGNYSNGVSTVQADPPDCGTGGNPSCDYITAVGFMPINGVNKLVAALDTGQWYLVNADLTLGSQLFGGTSITTTSFTYIPAAPDAGFSSGGILVGNSASQNITFYGLDSSGNLIGSGQTVVNNAIGGGYAPGAGIVRDPNTGNLYFTANNDGGLGQIYELQIGVPEPATFAVVALAVFWLWRRRAVTAPPS